MEKKNFEKKETEGQYIHITFRWQHVNYFILPDLTRQPAAIMKTKIESNF